MIYKPLWKANRVLVFNHLVLSCAKGQKDLTISIPLFIVLCFDLHSSLLLPCCFACNYALFMFCELLCFFFVFHSTTCWRIKIPLRVAVNDVAKVMVQYYLRNSTHYTESDKIDTISVYWAPCALVYTFVTPNVT